MACWSINTSSVSTRLATLIDASYSSSTIFLGRRTVSDRLVLAISGSRVGFGRIYSIRSRKNHFSQDGILGDQAGGLARVGLTGFLGERVLFWLLQHYGRRAWRGEECGLKTWGWP